MQVTILLQARVDRSILLPRPKRRAREFELEGVRQICCCWSLGTTDKLGTIKQDLGERDPGMICVTGQFDVDIPDFQAQFACVLSSSRSRSVYGVKDRVLANVYGCDNFDRVRSYIILWNPSLPSSDTHHWARDQLMLQESEPVCIIVLLNIPN